MTPDMINGLFELFGALAVAMSIRAVYKDKCYAGLSPYNLIFFNGWGIFNLYYYPHLNQYWSFWGGCTLQLANMVYLFALWYYPHRPVVKETYDVPSSP